MKFMFQEGLEKFFLEKSATKLVNSSIKNYSETTFIKIKIRFGRFKFLKEYINGTTASLIFLQEQSLS